VTEQTGTPPESGSDADPRQDAPGVSSMPAGENGGW